MKKIEYVIKGREPQALFNRFEDIASIPHGSGNEEQLADYIENFAKSRSLFCYRDKYNNLLVRRSASPGYENHPALLIQGHIDMVCEADVDVNIDFLHDGLSLYEDNGMLYANRTTLGADDGVAAAVMLALLDDKTLISPEIECLFTTEEETGLTGAQNFDYSLLHSRRMLNLDTGGEIVIVSCAGGMRTEIKYIPSKQLVYAHNKSNIDKKILKIEVSGLAGGHSGIDIHLGRGNANLIMIGLIKSICGIGHCNIISLHGGSKDNAIPSRCEAVLAVECENVSDVIVKVNNITGEIRKSLPHDDDAFSVFVDDVTNNTEPGEYKIYDGSFTEKLVGFTNEIPCGVIEMYDDIDMVKTSSNYAIIDCDENGLSLHISSRSSDVAELDLIKSKLEMAAYKYGFETETGSRYSGWEYDAASRIRNEYIAAYKEVTGSDIKVAGVHAGLECGIIKLAVPDMDIIATGVITYGEHTTKEALDLSSLSRVYEVIKLLCSRI